MEKIIKKLSFIIVVALSLSSCATSSSSVQYDKVYPLSSYCTLINGYWDDWKKLDSYAFLDYRVQMHYNKESFEILIYETLSHPSDYYAKITINKGTGKVFDKDWFTYQGIISTKDKLPINYMTNRSPAEEVELISKDYKTLQCEIRCDKEMQKAIQKNGLYGTMNVFYGNHSGNGFSFENR